MSNDVSNVPVVSNFADSKNAAKMVPWVKFEKGSELANLLWKGANPSKLLKLLDLADEIRAVCKKSLAEAEANNAKLAKTEPAKSKAAPSAPVASAPVAPVAETFYMSLSDGKTIGPVSRAGVIEFVIAHMDNPLACIHAEGGWKFKADWDRLGFMPPAAPPAPSAPVAPVVTAPAAPEPVVEAEPVAAPVNGGSNGRMGLAGIVASMKR